MPLSRLTGPSLMDSRKFIRGGGLLLIASGLALGYSYISHPHHMPPEVIASPSWIIIHGIFAFSIAGGLLGTTALYALSASRTGWTGLCGYILLFVGMMMIFGLDYYEVFIAPFLALNFPQVIETYGAGDTMGAVAVAFPVAGMCTVIGYALLGFAWKRSGDLPHFAANGLIATSIAFGVGLSPIGGILVAQITAAFFGASLIIVGVLAIKTANRFGEGN